jgi:hypothetical protein
MTGATLRGRRSAPPDPPALDPDLRRLIEALARADARRDYRDAKRAQEGGA